MVNRSTHKQQYTLMYSSTRANYTAMDDFFSDCADHFQVSQTTDINTAWDNRVTFSYRSSKFLYSKPQPRWLRVRRIHTSPAKLTDNDRELLNTSSDCCPELLCTEDAILELPLSLDTTKANGLDNISAV